MKDVTKQVKYCETLVFPSMYIVQGITVNNIQGNHAIQRKFKKGLLRNRFQKLTSYSCTLHQIILFILESLKVSSDYE